MERIIDKHKNKKASLYFEPFDLSLSFFFKHLLEYNYVTSVLPGMEKTGDHIGMRDSILTGRSVSICASRDSTSLKTHGSTMSVSPAFTSRSVMQSATAAPRLAFPLVKVGKAGQDGVGR